MIGEVFSILFGRFILAVIIMAVIGLIVGILTKSRGGRITWWIVFGLIVFIGVAVSGTMYTYDVMASTGQITFDELEILGWGTFAGIMTFYTLAQLLGSVIRQSVETDMQNDVEALSIAELTELIETVLSRPELASTPWVANHWYSKTPGNKHAWVEVNSQQLKIFIVDQGGLEDFNHSSFVVELQRLDRQSKHSNARNS